MAKDGSRLSARIRVNPSPREARGSNNREAYLLARSFRIAALLWPLSLAIHADTLTGEIVGIADGDTVTLRTDQETIQVRVAGIDAPEKRQPFGNASKKTLSDCAFGKYVQVESRKRDRYGRSVGKILADGIDCGFRQVQLGMAWHYKAYAKEQSARDRDLYSRAEDEAREGRLGLWQEPSPIPPWDFRHSKR